MCGKELRELGYRIENIDATIVAQRPKMQPYIPVMRERIADLLGINVGQISIKAKTEERLGFTGAEEGMSAHAICLIETL
jgi:2-C-methyl-D-erythritol 2,4-cyclodiphosphate synthase